MKTRLWVVSAMAAWLACDSGPNEQMAPGQLSLLELVQKRDNVMMSVDLEKSELVLDYNPFSGGCVSLSDVSFDVNGEGHEARSRVGYQQPLDPTVRLTVTP